jgi:hypothetical protein
LSVECDTREKLAHILRARPALAPLFECESSVREFATGLLRDPGSPGPLRPAVAAFVRDHVARLLGPDLAARCGATLHAANAFCSADHHGPISFPLLINSNLVYGAGHGPERPLQLVLSCAGVPLCNVSYPRGLYCRGRRLPFHPSRFQNCLVLRTPPAGREYFELAIDRSSLPDSDRAALRQLWASVWADERLRAARSYAEQVTVLNTLLWSRYFEDGSEPLPLVYVPMEELVTHLIVEGHLHDEPLFNALLFDAGARERCIRAFDGVGCAWTGGSAGTHFFWGVAEDSSSYPLRLDDGRLVGRKGAFALQGQELADHLRSGRIYPGVFLDYLVLMFLAGVVLAGGFNQVNVLTEMRRRLLDLTADLGLREHAARIAGLNTSGLVCGPALAAVQGIEPALGSPLRRSELAAAAERPLREVLRSNIDEIYAVVS